MKTSLAWTALTNPRSSSAEIPITNRFIVTLPFLSTSDAWRVVDSSQKEGAGRFRRPAAPLCRTTSDGSETHRSPRPQVAPAPAKRLLSGPKLVRLGTSYWLLAGITPLLLHKIRRQLGFRCVRATHGCHGREEPV